MIKYEVVTFSVETKDGKDAFEVWNNQVDQDEKVVKECNTLEEARAIYAEIITSARYTGNIGRPYYHKCKAINAVHYDDDGAFEYMDGVTCEAPDYVDAGEDYEDEDDEI